MMVKLSIIMNREGELHDNVSSIHNATSRCLRFEVLPSSCRYYTAFFEFIEVKVKCPLPEALPHLHHRQVQIRDKTDQQP
jgi:hypothetical protein